jgi:Lon protease-like protein
MPIALPAERKRLLPLLVRVVGDLGNERIPEPHQYDDAEWVGYRITEVLPIHNLAKQKLLELDDPLVRLEILEKFLDQRNLLG